MPGIRDISKKYLNLFVNESELQKLINHKGTMPGDIRVIKAVIAARLSDKKFMEGLVNDYMQAGQVKF